ncbi:MAG: hypothetical protein H7X89_08325 [Rhizobiales bacterium]|nr:hypothetical protein [Hyphomicrobiales bacterium]
MNNRVLAVTASLFLTLTMIAGDTAYAASKAGAQLTGSVDRSKGFNRLFSVEPVAVDGKSGFQFSTLGSYLKVPAGKTPVYTSRENRPGLSPSCRHQQHYRYRHVAGG